MVRMPRVTLGLVTCFVTLALSLYSSVANSVPLVLELGLFFFFFFSCGTGV
jgi:hypothetical protein